MNLLITRHDKIGDFIVTLPLFKVIKEQYPNTKITALVSKVNYDFAKEINFIDDVILFDKNNLSKTLEEIRDKEFDASISAYIDITLGKILFKSGIKIRIAPATKIAQIFFNKRVIQKRSKVEKTEWQYNIDLSKKLFPNIKVDFTKPLLDINVNREKRIIFHAGFGGSSEGNLSLDDYIKLARSIKNYGYEIVFSFGPDDEKSKEYIKENLDFDAIIFDSKISLFEFAKYIAASYLFISTSTGPMHLAGATNTKTLSFFGNTLFSSAKRWGTISNDEKQNNFTVPQDYSIEVYEKISNRLKNLLEKES